jgi:hypothetical protein
MKIVTAILMISLVAFVPENRSLRRILKDCQFSKLPKTARMVGNEVIADKGKRYGYLAFEGPTEDLLKWIKKSGLTQTFKEEIFTMNLMVWSAKRPTWFEDSSNRFMTADVYYSQREEDRFLILCWIDENQEIIHLEYEIGD